MPLQPDANIHSRPLNHSRKPCSREGSVSLRHEHEWARVAVALQAEKSTHLQPVQRMHARGALLNSTDVEHGAVEINLIPAKRYEFGGAQAVSEGHQDHRRVAM